MSDPAGYDPDRPLDPPGSHVLTIAEQPYPLANYKATCSCGNWERELATLDPHDIAHEAADHLAQTCGGAERARQK